MSEADSGSLHGPQERSVLVPAGTATLEGDLTIPRGGTGVVLFVHGSGGSRFSPRNRSVAHAFVGRGMGTLQIDLLSSEEQRIDEGTSGLSFDIPLLAERVALVTGWLGREPATCGLPVGYFGASTGAAAALVAAAMLPDRVAVVVSRGGRPDLAGLALRVVRAPTLLIVGGDDLAVLTLNREALRELRGERRLHIVPGVSHLFSESGALEEVARLSADWFGTYFLRARSLKTATERRAGASPIHEPSGRA